jgi:hypothetical protein
MIHFRILPVKRFRSLMALISSNQHFLSVVENQCLSSLSCRHLSNCTLLGQHPSAELFSDQNEAFFFFAKQLNHSFPLCPKEFLIIYMYVHELFFKLFYVFHRFSFVFKSYLHNYTLTHVSHHVSTTLFICSLRQRVKTTRMFI